MTQSAILDKAAARRASSGRWPEQRIEELFAPLKDGRTLHQGWSPQCEKVPSPSEEVWGVLKTTSIQPGEFQPEHNKLLPRKLEPRPLIEVNEGDILITCAGPRARCGVSCFVRRTRKRLMMSGKMYRFRVDPDRTDARYVEAFLQTERARLAIDNMKTGSSDSGLNLTHSRFRGLLIPVAPLYEQQQIVAEIEKQSTRLEAGVVALRRVQANLKRYRAAVLKAACEGRLVPTEAELAKAKNRQFETGKELLARLLTDRRKNWQGRGKYKEPTALDSTALPQLPKHWTWATLDQIAQEGRPIIYGIIKPGPHVPDGVPYVRVTEMKDGRIDVPNLRRASRERAAKFARATLASGDVLISKDGTIGRVAVVPPELAGGNITQHVMRAPIHAMIVRDFAVWAVRSDWCQHWLTGETRGVALRGVNVEDFRRLPIPIPPLAEQTRIVAEVERRLSVVEELETVVSANLQRAIRLQQSVLHSAFSPVRTPA